MPTDGTIIIGAGPAGLACAAALRSEGQGSTILEATHHVGASWHKHYDRLHLHTAKAHSALPGMPMPRDFPRYPSRLQVIRYLDDYAYDNSLKILFGKRAVSIRNGDCWAVETADGDQFRARSVVIATGLANTPIRPTWEGQDKFAGPIVHSSEYRNADALDARRVLVVGFGNSAGEIALECAEAGLDVALSVRGPVNVVAREIFGIPSATIAIAQSRLPPKLADAINAPFLRMRYPDLEELGLKRASSGPLSTMIQRGRTPLIDIGTMAKIREGHIEVFPGVDRSDDGTAYFANGKSFQCNAIVLATGYDHGLGKILPDLAERFPEADRPPRNEVHPAGDGLYFCGFNAATTGLLRQIGIEAGEIVASIGQRHGP
ncbi:MAG: NAD(P)/FAD-dependent oxidoreductase [Rhizobiaceae bacterium]|nr:NAD(P)/FAD-dependent oxidoreductase [Rhizobiaceae bacterium]